MSEAAKQELIRLNEQLLTSISTGDWKLYTQLCDETLSAFEPEANGYLVEGMPFHEYYFNLPDDGAAKTPTNTTIVQPHVRLMGDAAVVSFVRLTQYLNADGQPETRRSEETRVWQKIDGKWKHVHFHRS